MQRLLIHVVVSIITFLFLGLLSGFIVKQFIPSAVPAICAGWNKYHVMELSLILAGIFNGLLSYWIATKYKTV